MASVRSSKEYPTDSALSGREHSIFYVWNPVGTEVIISHGGVFKGAAKFRKGAGWYADRGYPSPSPQDIAALAAEHPLGPSDVRKNGKQY